MRIVSYLRGCKQYSDAFGEVVGFSEQNAFERFLAFAFSAKVCYNTVYAETAHSRIAHGRTCKNMRVFFVMRRLSSFRVASSASMLAARYIYMLI